MTHIVPIRAAASSVAATGGLRPTATSSKGNLPSENPADGDTAPAKLAAGFYVDGFNLYHGIASLDSPHLKWCDLRKLCTHFLDKAHERIARIVWCSAETADLQKRDRHRAYQKALKTVEVEYYAGHFIGIPTICDGCGTSIKHPCSSCGTSYCTGCGSEYKTPNEKEADVNLAIQAIADGIGGKIDVFYLITADSDQGPTIKMLMELGKTVRVLTPPGKTPSYLLQGTGCAHSQIDRTHIENSLFNGPEVHAGGKFVVRRPASYTPPGQPQPQVVKGNIVVERKKQRKIVKPK